MDMLEELADKINNIRNAPTPGAYVRQRIGERAQALSLAGQAQSQVEGTMEALAKLTTLLYQADVDGSFANVDANTWRILIPVAWGSSGWKLWGLRSWEADVLRHILMTRAQNRNPLFDYNAQAKTWHVNLQTYATLEGALTYWQRRSIGLSEWRTETDCYRQRRIKAQSKRYQGVIKP